MLSPAARAAAFLLAELLLRLLQPLLAGKTDLPAETAAALQRNLEDLIQRLRHIAQTGERPADQPPSPAPPVSQPRLAPTTPQPRRHAPRRRTTTHRHQPQPAPHLAQPRRRQRIAPQTPAPTHV